MKPRFSSKLVSARWALGFFLVFLAWISSSETRAESNVSTAGACCFNDLTCHILTAESCDLRGGYFLGEGSVCDSNPCNDSPSCLLTPSTIDFGAVGISQFRDKNLRITNVGGRFLNGLISEACIEYSIIGDRFYDLGPGQSKIFTLRYAPQKEGASSCGFSLGEDCPELVVYGTGESAPRCEVSPAVLDFGPVTIDEGRDLIFTVANNGGGFLTGNVRIDCPDFFLAGTGGYNLESGQSQDFVVRFLPVETGERTCFIEIDGCDPLLATATGEVAPVCLFDPDPILFDSTFVGESSEQVFYLTNSGGGVLEGELDLDCEDFRLMGNTTYRLAPGDTAFYSLVFEPEQVGGQLCEVRAEAPCQPLSAVGHATLGPRCLLSATEIDYGTVYLGDSSVRDLVLTNDGESLLEGALHFDCSEFSVLGKSTYRLGAGESATFDIAFAPEDRGEVRCSLVLGDRCEAVSLLGTGEDAPVCSVEPSVISFGQVPLQSVVFDSLTVTNLGDGFLVGEAVLTCSDPGLQMVGETSLSLPAGGSAILRIAYQPTGPVMIDCSLFISERCSTVQILGQGIEVPECEITPASLSFGAVPVGLFADSSIVVTNTGSGVLSGEPTFDCGEFTLEGSPRFELEVGESEIYQVRFTPTAESEVSCQIDFGSACGPWLTEGEGLGPICSISTSLLDFGVVIPGKSDSRSFFVSNLGGGNLTGVVTWDCVAYLVDGQSPDTAISYDLQAGESDTFLVEFLPPGPLQHNCSISLGQGCDTVELLGSGGEPPQCDLTPSAIDMVVELGVATTASAVVTNRGQGRLGGTLSPSCEFLQILTPLDFSLSENESVRIEFSVTATTLGRSECQIGMGNDCAPLVVDVSVVPRRGACCLLDGSCRVLNENGCEDIQGTSWDPDSRCEEGSCRPQGACCLIDGGCRLGPPEACSPGTGTYLGDGLSCDPDPCPTAGACCLQTGECLVTTSDRCAQQGGFWFVDGDCGGGECVSIGACCLLDEMCIFVPQTDCLEADGFFLGAEVICSPKPCDPVGACCSAEGGCRILSQAACQSELGVVWTKGATCAEASCDPRGACCLENGSCLLLTEATCPDRYLGNGTVCSVTVCRQIGACCDPQGECTISLRSSCEGTFLGSGVDCDPSPCHSRVQSVQVLRNDMTTLLRVDTDDPRIEELQGWYRRGGEPAFSKMQSFTQDGNQWTSALSVADYSIRGVEYYLQYVDVQLGLIVFHGSADQPRRVVLSDEVTAPPAVAKRFRLVSPPAAIAASSMGAWLEESFGPAGRTNWRLGWWDPTAERYIEHSADRPLSDVVGRGYWLAFATDTKWTFPATTRYPDDSAAAYRVALSPGWNMIGNPAAYAIGVDPQTVLVEDGGQLLTLANARPRRVGEILVHVSGNSEAGTLAPYRTEQVSLDPWTGGWIENRTDHEISLLVPAVEVEPLLGRGVRTDMSQERKAHALSLTAESESESARIELHLHPEAKPGLDAWDIGAPPAAPDRELALSWSSADRRLLRSAIPDLESTRVTFTVSSASPVTLSWTVEEGVSVQLVDESEQNTSIDLTSVRSVGLPAGVHQYEIAAVFDPDGEQSPSPDLESGRISIEPNPVRQTTRLLLELETAERVRLDLFSPSGQRVWSEDRGFLPAGRHLFVWEGRGGGGELLPTGTYFVAARIGGETFTRKLVLIR